MKHYILLKTAPDCDRNRIFAELQETYRIIDREIDSVSDLQIEQNIYHRDGNYDFLISFSITDTKMLEYYLRHPRHIQLAEKMKDSISGKITFDCEEVKYEQ